MSWAECLNLKPLNLNNMNTQVSTPIQVLSIKEFVAANKFKQIAPSVRENTNKYPFVTFINGDNVAENVYFSKNAAKAVTSGTPVSKDMLAQYQIGIVTNATGEKRVKLISNSDRLELDDLL